jgi:histidine ammonia-lyase
MRRLIEGSTFTRPDDPLNVQDAYTLRCIPQVHGAIRDAIAYARWVMNIELNSATDNPLIFFDENDNATVLSGGNFHGEPLAISMDYLAFALAELGNISERRIARLVDADSNNHILPPFLINEGGVNSGFMLIQYTAAALASENKALSHPSSVDTIPTSANIEDHVSMGPAAARQAREIAANVEAILAMELLSAAPSSAPAPGWAGEPPRHTRSSAAISPSSKRTRRSTPKTMRKLVGDGSLLKAEIDDYLNPPSNTA